MWFGRVHETFSCYGPVTIGRVGDVDPRAEGVMPVWQAQNVIRQLARDGEWGDLAPMAAALTDHGFLAPDHTEGIRFVAALVSAIERGDVVVRAGWHRAWQERPEGRGSVEPEAPAAAAAAPAAAAAKERTWVAVEVTYDDGTPYTGPYTLTLADGSRRTGNLDGTGQLDLRGIDPGTCKLSLPEIDGSLWKPA